MIPEHEQYDYEHMKYTHIFGTIFDWEEVVSHSLIREFMNQGCNGVHRAIRDDQRRARTRVSRFLRAKFSEALQSRDEHIPKCSDTYRPFWIRLLILVQVMLHHKRQDLRDIVTIRALIRASLIPSCEIRAPTTTPFGRRRCACCVIGAKRAKRRVVRWLIVANERILVERDADIHELATAYVSGHRCMRTK